MAMLGPKGQQILVAWANSNPEQVAEWASNGSLMQRLKQEEQKAADALTQAKADGMTHLADHEIYETYGGPVLAL